VSLIPESIDAGLFGRDGSEDNSVSVSRIAECVWDEEIQSLPVRMEFLNQLMDGIGGSDEQVSTGPVTGDVEPDAAMSRLHDGADFEQT